MLIGIISVSFVSFPISLLAHMSPGFDKILLVWGSLYSKPMVDAFTGVTDFLVAVCGSTCRYPKLWELMYIPYYG